MDNDLKNIFNEIIKIDSNFNYENYEIVKSKGITTVNVVNNIESECAKYIDLYFKIGDFYTNAGYTIKLKDNMINQYKEKYKDFNIKINNQTHKYYYDIENEKNI